MLTKSMRLAVIALLCTSVIIYILQILIFRDPNTTAFYIFQDFAFMPVTIALATIVFGAITDEKEKRERAESVRMLTSSFFTEVGAELMYTMMDAAEDVEVLRGYTQAAVTATRENNDELLKQAEACEIRLNVDEKTYHEVQRIVTESRFGLLVLASNPLILEQERFTSMLWGVFHLADEFRIRGDYRELSIEDKEHVNEDFAKVLKPLIVNSIPNATYLRDMYPNFYSAVRDKAKESPLAEKVRQTRGLEEISE